MPFVAPKIQHTESEPGIVFGQIVGHPGACHVSRCCSRTFASILAKASAVLDRQRVYFALLNSTLLSHKASSLVMDSVTAIIESGESYDSGGYAKVTKLKNQLPAWLSSASRPWTVAATCD